MPGKAITAAGTVVLRSREGKQPHVLIVHRPGYDDWSLPKGKVETDETLAGCAARETAEETGITVRLGVPVDTISYPVGGGTKSVTYWRGMVVDVARRKPDAEVDKVVWLSPKNALARMTYEDEKQLVRQGLELPETTPLLIVRHGKAMLRKHWSGRDQARPVNARGRRQNAALVPLLQAYGVQRLASSSSTRCVQTLQPYAKASGLDIEGWATLSEEQAEINLKAVGKLMKRMVRETAEAGVPLAVCGHRPVLPTMLAALGIPPRPMQTAAVAVAHLDAAGHTVAVEWHKPRL